MSGSGEAWSNSLSEDERQAIKDYTGSAYVNINSVLRGHQSSFEGDNYEKAKNIHKALANSEIPCDCKVYRGASINALGIYKNASDEELVGKIITDKGFMSTSMNRDKSFSGDVKMEISVPSGAHGAYVGYVGTYGHLEEEVLFDAGQRLQITGARTDEYGRKIISAIMLKPMT